jgi:hypothetical protein
VKLPFTSVVSLHTDPATCGVAKFSKQFAERLGVPFYGLTSLDRTAEFPLLSLKASELREAGLVRVRSMPERFGLFWHDHGFTELTKRAEVVFYADPSLGQPALWCPSLLHADPVPRGAINLFAMGMAHKINPEPYKKIAALIAQTGHTFHLRVSMGLHEGTDLSDAVLKCEALADAIGKENLTVLGILTDEAVASEYAQCQAVCAFFEKGARANNTTVHAAMSRGLPVITNLDSQSPPDWKHNVSVFDVNALTAWPGVLELRRVGDVAKGVSQNYSWDSFLAGMHQIYANAHNR